VKHIYYTSNRAWSTTVQFLHFWAEDCTFGPCSEPAAFLEDHGPGILHTRVRFKRKLWYKGKPKEYFKYWVFRRRQFFQELNVDKHGELLNEPVGSKFGKKKEFGANLYGFGWWRNPLSLQGAHSSFANFCRIKTAFISAWFWYFQNTKGLPRMEKSHSCWPRTVWCVVNMFHKNRMRSLKISNGTKFTQFYVMIRHHSMFFLNLRVFIKE